MCFDRGRGMGEGMRYLPEMFRRCGSLRRFAAGDQIFQKDAPAGEIYYLERGKVRAYLLYPDGTERTLCFVERGNLVGEEAVKAGLADRVGGIADAFSWLHDAISREKGE